MNVDINPGVGHLRRTEDSPHAKTATGCVRECVQAEGVPFYCLVRLGSDGRSL